MISGPTVFHVKHRRAVGGGFHVKQSERRPGAVRAEDVQSALERAGVSVSREQAVVLAEHACEVISTNDRMNLTGIRDVQDFIELHIVDSLAPLAEVMGAPSGSLVDIGTGGGYPGLPLAIVTRRPCVLLEATQKKATFLTETVAGLRLDGVTVANARAEEYARQTRDAFSVAVVRGVGELATVVELAAPLLQRHGRLVAYKGRPSPEEIQRGARAAAMCGLVDVSERRYELPGGQGRTVIVYEKSCEPRVALPRRPGMAAKRPLV
jgi:16S rRNA (guanine527-N7)-methyltransferase